MEKYRIQVSKELQSLIRDAAARRFMTPTALVGLAVYELLKNDVAKPEPTPEPAKPVKKAVHPDDLPYYLPKHMQPKTVALASEWDD